MSNSPAEKFANQRGQTERFSLPTPGAESSSPEILESDTHRTGASVPSSGKNMLSKKQKMTLGIIARKAFNFQQNLGLIEDGMSFTDWRRQQQKEAVGIDSLRKCRQSHYRPLRGHFKALAGDQSAAAFQDAVSPADDPDRQTVSEILKQEVENLSRCYNRCEKFHIHGARAYLLAIARKRSPLAPAETVQQLCETWSVRSLWSLVYTLRNRIKSFQGKGDPGNRNKSQKNR